MMRKSKNLVKKTEERLHEARRPWDLFEETDRWFADLRNEFDRKFWGTLTTVGSEALAVREPLADLEDSGREYVFKAELPGVNKDELDLRVTPEGIEVAAETRQEKDESGKDYAYRERSYRSFRRRLAFPEEVVADAVKASLKDGVLEVHIPKKEPSPRHEPVKVRVE